MTDTSDGEQLNRKFDNLKGSDTTQKIGKSFPFLRLCYNVKQGVNIDIIIKELKSQFNTDKLKEYFAIPRRTIVEPNIANVTNGAQRTVSLFFKHKNNIFKSKIKLPDDLVDNISEKYINHYLKNQNENNNTSIDIDNPTEQIPEQNTSAKINTTLEEKLDLLTEEVRKLTSLLIEEKEKNKQLNEKLLEFQSKSNSSKTAKKRKIGNDNSYQTKRSNNAENEAMSVNETSDEYEESSDTADYPQLKKNKKAYNKATTKNTAVTPRATVVEQNALGPKSQTKREKNVPPIVVFDSDQKRMNERIKNNKACSNGAYHFVRVNKSKYRIHSSTLNQYDAILALLSELNIKYHTYTPNERKQIHVLLKHFPVCYEEDDILHYLKSEYELIPIRLSKFITKRMIDSGLQSPIWHASFDPKTDKKRIYGINHIGNLYGITVEELKNNSLTQCKRCWRFEHTHSNCRYDTRCNNCLASHEAGKCALDTNAALKPSCVNCKSISFSQLKRMSRLHTHYRKKGHAR